MASDHLIDLYDLRRKKIVWSGGPEKALSCGKKRKSGRNNYGRITVRHMGGGHKRLYRVVDFKRNKFGVEGIVFRIEYDPNRSSLVALINYCDDSKGYILAPSELKIGDKIISGNGVDIKVGNAMPLSLIPVGTFIHNIELKCGKGGQIARSAGTYAQIIGKEDNRVLVRLRSKVVYMINSKCLATIGIVSNANHRNRSIGKAGRSRWLGIRPSVRGVAMNPVDHPHGGGEGKSSGGRHPVTPWGVPTKGKRTRKSKNKNILYVK